MNQAIFRISPMASDPQALTFSVLTPDGWAPHANGLRLRTDGRFHAARSANSMYTLIAGGRRYLVNTSVEGYGHFRDSALLAQKLQPGEALSAAWKSRVGNLWLAVNEQPDSSTYSDDGGPLLAVGDIPGLAGYVIVFTGSYGNQVVDPGVSDALGAMFLQIPGFGSRDLEDAVIERHGSEDWIRFGSTLYRPEAAAPALAAGPNTVTFGAEGYAEWRVLAAGAKFPATANAPSAGCYLLLFGPAGTRATVTVALVTAAKGPATVKSAAARYPKHVIRLR